MSILQEIQNWSTRLPAWQQHAVNRIYESRQLDEKDLEEVYALLKSHYGIPNPIQIQALTFTEDQIATIENVSSLIQIKSIRNLKNINALAENEELPISPTGLTIIYGENGAGKSGYSRLLKKVCRARDQREQLLPNANLPPEETGPAEAEFEVIKDGNELFLHWLDGEIPPVELSNISTFDSLCAKAYIDNQGDFAYIPYGLDILTELVSVCGKLRAKIDSEIKSNTPNLDVFSELSKTRTKTGSLLSNLSHQTSALEVEQLASLTDQDNERLNTLTKTLAESDPKQKAQIFRQKALRYKGLVKVITESSSIISSENEINLKTLIEKYKSAKSVADIAAKEFKETPRQLIGTGNETWKILFDSAREFSKECYPSKSFPNFEPTDKCPLCQNELGEHGAARLISFEKFIQQAAEKLTIATRTNATNAFKIIEKTDLKLNIDEALKNELSDYSPQLLEACFAFDKALKKRQENIISAASGKMNWEDISALPESPNTVLSEATVKLEADAKALEATFNADAKQAMINEQNELLARSKLTALKDLVLDFIAKLELCYKLGQCSSNCVTTAISRKSTELARTIATPEVITLLNRELASLNVHELRVTMQNSSPGGRNQFKLILEKSNGARPSDILSEGEQRAIAIASFLTEVNLSNTMSGVIFDDPVSSLDHRRRWHVAKRLVEESKKRQVIIFTHDIYFLCILQQESQELNSENLTQCIRKTPQGFGVHTDRLPFDALSTSKRVKALRGMHNEISRSHKNGDEESTKKLTQDAYYHLRMAWERSVEEILFQGVVNRFSEGISTQKLRYVVVEDEDFHLVDSNMTRCSKFAHDGAAIAMVPIPHPDEVIKDIEILETWRVSIESRKKAIETRRA
ncbi:TPA: AAA family ATPase [Yersinia enterocolitica]